ncbi:MAG TPA: polysaccharide biosynthesis/export family protein [Steroidobacteraceae bacterium]|jgi:polysaccharide export outer membrane protein
MRRKIPVMFRHYSVLIWLLGTLSSLFGPAANAAETASYLIQPGDVLVVSVWKETDLQSEVLVRPDGGLSLPLAGEFDAAGHSIEDMRAAIATKLDKYVPNAVVTVSLKQIGGNRVYVIGKVNRPGEYTFTKAIDVMQALSLAGGTTSFAALNDIQILRRDGDKQQAIGFRYGDIEGGRKLEQNILLRSGDTVVVP